MLNTAADLHAYRYYVVSMPQYVLHPFFTNGNTAFDLLQYLKHAMRNDDYIFIIPDLKVAMEQHLFFRNVTYPRVMEY